MGQKELFFLVFTKPPPQASLSCFRERVGEWGENGELTTIFLLFSCPNRLLIVSVTRVACRGGKGRPVEEAGFETIPIFSTSALPNKLSHLDHCFFA